MKKQLTVFQPKKVETKIQETPWWEKPIDASKIIGEQFQVFFNSKREYYKSEEWRQQKIFALHRANNRCEWCGLSHSLELHHLTYDNLYNEKPKDLIILCKDCHKKADKKREEEESIEQYHSAVDTYATKKYGEGWEYYHGEEIEEEFDEWVESQEGY